VNTFLDRDVIIAVLCCWSNRIESSFFSSLAPVHCESRRELIRCHYDDICYNFTAS
jgi:hypothetical protein